MTREKPNQDWYQDRQKQKNPRIELPNSFHPERHIAHMSAILKNAKSSVLEASAGHGRHREIQG
jgi:hypothetical protein